MLTRWLGPFLDAFPWWRGRAAWVLAALLVGAPLAFLAGRESQLRTASASPYQIEGYHETLGRARATARALGVDTSGWTHLIRFSANDEMNRYMQAPRTPPLPEAVRALLPVTVVKVILHSAGRERWVEFAFNQHARLIQYGTSPGLLDQQTAERARAGRALAEAAVSTVLEGPAFAMGEPTATSANAGRAEQFDWSPRANCCPELEITASATVEGPRLAGFRVAASFTSDYQRRRSSPVNLLADLLRWAFLLGASLFVGLRFARRAMEGEVPYGRALVILAGCVAVGIVQLWLVPSNINFNDSPGVIMGSFRYLGWSLGVLIATVLGILMALAYGGTEGDAREYFEERLTSLDALLSGRWWSRNVGLAVLGGAAVGAWSHGVTQLARRWVAPGFIPLLRQELMLSFSDIPWMGLLAASLVDALITMITLLPVPLALGLWRRQTSGSAAQGAGLAALAVAGALTLQDPLAGPAAMAMAASSVATLWLGFAGFDVVAALVALMVTRFGASLVDLMAVMPAWEASAPMARGVALATLLAAAAASVWGRRWRSADVRPKYARNIEQRHFREAEVLAAREAQLRLLPDRPPSIAGLGLAAFCAPAQGVSGDFFDFFPMPRGRLGVLVADGRTGGLSAALTIALAKGFLQYAAQRDWGCGDALSHLREVLGAEADLNLSYAVCDPRAGRVEFARLGATPVLLAGLGRGENTVDLTGPLSGGITEGQTSFGDGDVLLIYTDGVPQRLEQTRNEAIDTWLSARLRPAADPLTAQQLGEALSESLRAHEGNAPDDLTAVVIRFEAAGAREAVA